MTIPSLSRTAQRSESLPMAPAQPTRAMAPGAVSLSLLSNRDDLAPSCSSGLRSVFTNLKNTLSKRSVLRSVAQPLPPQQLAPAARAGGLSAPSLPRMYDADGALSSMAMKEVLTEVNKALKTLAPKAHNATQLIDKALNNPARMEPKKLYGTLKDVSHAIADAGKDESVQRLAAAVMQMARTHNYQVGIGEYDNVGETATATCLKNNPTIEHRSNAFTQHGLSLAASGAVKLGAAAGVVDAASVTAKLGLNLSKSNMIYHDLDDDSLLIKKGHVGVSLSASGKVGDLDNTLRAAALSGSIGVKGLRGFMAEGEKVGDAIHYGITHAREGGGAFSRELAPSKSALKSLANLSTRGVTGTLAGVARSIKNWLWEGPLADRQVTLNTHKIIKGGDPAFFLVKENSLLRGMQGCQTLQRVLDRTYTNLPQRELPASLKPIVGDGDWFEAEGNCSANAAVLEIDTGSVNISGGGASVNASLNHRWLPYRLWMTPHTALQALSDGDVETKDDMLNKVCATDPAVAGYLDKLDGAGVRGLKQDLDDFEALANRLLTMQGVIRGGDSSPILKAHAQARFERDGQELGQRFGLDDVEREGLVAHGDRLELTLARCWNRLSLGHAQTSLALMKPSDRLVLEELDRRIKAPQVLMAPTHLYQASSLQLEASLKRLRTTVAFTLSLPGITAEFKKDKAMGSLSSLGQLNATLTHDKVSMHPNLVRNGQFMTINLSIIHFPGFGVTDKVTKALATKIVNHLQSGSDAKQLKATEHAFLVGALSGTLTGALTTALKSEGGAGGSVSREFEIGLHQSEEGAPWLMGYFQPSNIGSTSIHIGKEVSIAAGLGGGAGLQVARSTLGNVVRPPILGSAPSFHLLQLPLFTQALCTDAQRSVIAPHKATYKNLLKHDVATMYFSNNAILDQLEHVSKLKQEQTETTDVFGRLALLPRNTQQYRAFCSSGLAHQTLDSMIARTRSATADMSMDQRLKHFTNTGVGKALLQEYASAMVQLATMKSRASLPSDGTHEGAMKVSLLNGKGEKVQVDMFARPAVDRR